MNRPERIVMSQSPNRHYLQGYNAAVESCEAYQKHLIDLLARVVNKHCPVDCPDYMDPLLKQEIAEVMKPYVEDALGVDIS